MTTDITYPNRPLYINENEELVTGLLNAFSQQLEIPADAINIKTHFLNRATGEYYPENRFGIAVDHSFSDKVPEMRAIVRAFGLPDEHTWFSLASVFVEAAAKPVIENLKDRIYERTGQVVQTYGLWHVSEESPNPPDLYITFAHHDPNAMVAVLQDDEFPSHVEIDNGHGTTEYVRILHTYDPNPSAELG